MALTAYQIEVAIRIANMPRQNRTIRTVHANPATRTNFVTRLQDKRTIDEEIDHLAIVETGTIEQYKPNHPHLDLVGRFARAEMEYVFGSYLSKFDKATWYGKKMRHPTPTPYGLVLRTNTLDTDLKTVQPVLVREYVKSAADTLKRRGQIRRANRKAIRHVKQLERQQKINAHDAPSGSPRANQFENNYVYGTTPDNPTPQVYLIDFELWKFLPRKKNPKLIDKMRYERALLEADIDIYLENGKQVTLAQVYESMEHTADSAGQHAIKRPRYQQFKQWLAASAK